MADNTESTPKLSRKQRELANRHELFLSIARDKLHQHGFHQLTMEQVAEEAEYSKGTLYQHFTCKEEMLIQLSTQAVEQMHRLAVQAAEYEGTSRQKLIAFIVGHELWQRLFRCDVLMQQNLLTDGVLEKALPASLEKYHALEHSIIGLACGIFQTAIDNKELSNHSFKAIELVYGLWSMCYGGQLLRSYQLPLNELGVTDPGNTIIALAQVMLDGLGLKPAMSAAQTHALVEHLEFTYFAATLHDMQKLSESSASTPVGMDDSGNA